LTEWYVNGPLGIEQGFSIAERPAQAHGLPLTIALALSGDLAPVLENDGQALTLRNSRGAALKYSGLTAQDADGKDLHAWLELQDDQLLLRIDDAGVRYPIVIDPWIQLAELSASDGAANDFFGSATAISGTTVVVGAPQCNHRLQCRPGSGLHIRQTHDWLEDNLHFHRQADRLQWSRRRCFWLRGVDQRDYRGDWGLHASRRMHQRARQSLRLPQTRKRLGHDLDV
jgi:hypothetical protein